MGDAIDDKFLSKINTYVSHPMGTLSNDFSKRVDLVNIANTQYLGNLYLGTPNSQENLLVFDTGSNWLVVISDYCVSNKNCTRANYNTSKSQSALKLEDSMFE